LKTQFLNDIQQDFCIFWFRRDLRLEDNTALNAALSGSLPVLPVFLFDRNILDKLSGPEDKRLDFIQAQLQLLKTQFEKRGSTLYVAHCIPVEEFGEFAKTGKLKAVYTNHDYEPYAIARDLEVQQLLEGQGIGFHTYKDQVIFEKEEVVKADGNPFTVFTPYSKKWLSTLEEVTFKMPVTHWKKLLHCPAVSIPSIEELGFKSSSVVFPSTNIPVGIISNYGKTRDLPELPTSKMGLHLRFGTLSIRTLVEVASRTNKVYLNELIWREFFMSILFHHPEVLTQSFRPEYDRIEWRNDSEEFDRWCKGTTGFPLVDAGMRELSTTGFMHNRVRMVTASFLAKDLLIDWRWGEAWFAQKLLDFELSANNGNWQWAAGCGCDAAPYFRIFNPDIQLKKFDPDLTYVKRWVPEFGTSAYPAPMLDHAFARERCLKTYKIALQS